MSGAVFSMIVVVIAFRAAGFLGVQAVEQKALR